MKTIKYAVVAGLLATSALTASAGGKKESKPSYNDFVFKARLGYAFNSDKIKNQTSTTKHEFKNSYTGEIAGDYFFTPNVAVEASVGYMRGDLKRTATNANKKESVAIVPVTALAQYYFMPSAEVSPYVGLGYSYQFASGGPSGTKVDNGGGIVGQVGLDVPMNDTFGLNLDVKHTYKASHDLKYSGTKYKAKLSSTTVMAGVILPF
ncbi:MAG: OmpW family outer membrane protein [Rickettsiales bacterium]